jgi:hypothetical protein
MNAGVPEPAANSVQENRFNQKAYVRQLLRSMEGNRDFDGFAWKYDVMLEHIDDGVSAREQVISLYCTLQYLSERHKK